MPPKKHRHLTPEERRELKIQKRIQRKLQKAERKRQLKRDHLAREVKYGELNYKKYERDWRKMLIKVTLPRMREELEFAWHNFERVIDCKDFTISLLMDELKDSEEQYMHNFRTHAENIEKLMKIFHDRLDELREDYDHEASNMQLRYDNEFLVMKEGNNEQFDYMKTMLHRLEIERREHNRIKKGEYISRLDEVESKNQLSLQRLRANLENKYKRMFDDMQAFIKNYNKKIRDRRKEHNALKEQDDAIQLLIGHQFRQIKKFYEVVRKLKQKYNNMKQTEGYTLWDLQIERKYFSNSFLALKQNLDNEKKDDFNKLVRLSECYNVSFDFLEKLNKKGEMILTLAAVCRKLETQKEKILPFPHSTAHPLLLGDDKDRVEGIKPEMELFWQRVGQAFGVHYTLSREKKCLNEENDLLIETHNAYCEQLMYPEIKQYKKLTTIPQTDVNFEMKKYKMRKVRTSTLDGAEAAFPMNLFS